MLFAHGIGPVPPLKVLWRSSDVLATAMAVGSTVYGISTSGRLVATEGSTGAARWRTEPKYIPGRLSYGHNRLYLVQPGAGLAAVTDNGSSFSERLLLELPSLTETTPLSDPAAGDSLLHMIVGHTLIAVDPVKGGMLYQQDLPEENPYTLMSLDQDLLVVSGSGQPSRWRAGTSGYSRVWLGAKFEGYDLSERAALILEDKVIVADRAGVSAYDKTSGKRNWTANGVGNLAFASLGLVLYCAGNQAAMWALNPGDGSTRWDRKHLAAVRQTPRVQLALTDDHLWVGALLTGGSEPAALWAVDRATGQFVWQATGVALTYGNGLPLLADGRIYTYGAQGLTAMTDLGTVPGVGHSDISQTPNPLRGPMSGFVPVELEFRLSVPASVSIIAWHERDARDNSLGPIRYQPGKHSLNYDARWPRGWTDSNQFGRLAVDVEETETGLRYTQVLLVPVNTLPDIHHHWAKQYIETMIYHRYIGGYPDLTFRPNNLVTRAESSTIIAKTLGTEKPSPSFETKFVDIDDHWARPYIMALEERGIISGFQEPDGSYTFRPNWLMTRAQEARILVRAYEIAAAPPEFRSKFTDIRGHWAEADIKALESAGYVNGFREADGTYTYRPEQHLTRAELCTVVVRIRKLTRP